MQSIESILEQNLRPVRAPEELWERVNAPGKKKDRRLVWAMAAAMIVAGLAWSLGRVETFRSSEPAAIRAWVISRTGMDVPLVGGEVAGARVRHGTVEVAYRAGALVVAKASGPGDSVHWGKAVPVSWTMGGQVYTLEGDLEAGCRLCHAEGVLN